PVDPCPTGDRVVEALERAVRTELQEAERRVAAVDPRRVTEPVDGGAVLRPAGREPEGEQLVEDGPQEGEPDGDAQDRERATRDEVEVVGAGGCDALAPDRS